MRCYRGGRAGTVAVVHSASRGGGSQFLTRLWWRHTVATAGLAPGHTGRSCGSLLWRARIACHLGIRVPETCRAEERGGCQQPRETHA